MWHINIHSAVFFLTSFHWSLNLIPATPFFMLTPVDLYEVAYFIMLEPDSLSSEVAVWSMVTPTVQL